MDRLRCARTEHTRAALSRTLGTHDGPMHSSSLIACGQRIGPDFEFQRPGGELAQRGVDPDKPHRRFSQDPLVLNAEFPRSIKGPFPFVDTLSCRPGFKLQFVKLDFLPRCQVHFHREVNPVSGEWSEGNRLAIAIRHSGAAAVEKARPTIAPIRSYADAACPPSPP